MVDGFSGGLGERAVDSVEIHKKNQCLQQSSRLGGLISSVVTTPQCYSDLYPDVHDTPTPKPSFAQSNVYPQRSSSMSNRNQQTRNQLGVPSSPPSTKTPVHNQLPCSDNPNNLTPPQQMQGLQYPNLVRDLANTHIPTSVPNPNSTAANVASVRFNRSSNKRGFVLPQRKNSLPLFDFCRTRCRIQVSRLTV